MRPGLSTNINAGDASADITGQTIDAAFVLYASAQAKVTGTSTGTLKLQFSNDPPTGLLRDATGNLIPVNWSDVPSATVAVAGAGLYVIPKTDICYRWIRSLFVHTNAASGTLTSNINTIGA